jgi:hypothetical protein
MRQQVCSVLLLLGHLTLFWAPSLTFNTHVRFQMLFAVLKSNLPSWAPSPS